MAVFQTPSRFFRKGSGHETTWVSVFAHQSLLIGEVSASLPQGHKELTFFFFFFFFLIGIRTLQIQQ